MDGLIVKGSAPTVMLFTGVAGSSLTAQISKNGGAFAAAANAPVEVGVGTSWYALLLDATETDTDGPLVIVTSAGSVFNFLFQVFDGFGGDIATWAGAPVNALVSGNVPAAVALLANDAIDASVLANSAVSKIFEGVALGELYAADGAQATPAQLLYMLWSALSEFSISGVTLTCKQLDGSTPAMTFTLAPAGNPTSRTRAT